MGERESGENVRAKIRAELEKLKPDTTMCPGKLSRNVGSTLRELRPTLEAMARAGEMQFYQKGERVRPGGFRGPFRVGRGRV
jgi:hypothetical protein